MNRTSYLPVAILVATYRRPILLSRLLDSIEKAVPEMNVRVIVVDNDPKRSAQPVVAARKDERLVYLCEPRPGISHARNAGIAASEDVEYVVFIDDDEVVSQCWLNELLDMAIVSEADAVAGPVISVLGADCPKWIRDSHIFDRERRISGSALPEAGAGNLLLRRSVFADLSPKEWFDPEFGLTGGEDAEFTRRLVRLGYSLIWSDNAVAWEEVPSSRTNAAWLIRRYRRIAGVDYRLGPSVKAKRIRATYGGILRILGGLLRLGLVFMLHQKVDAMAFKRVARGIGFLSAAIGCQQVEYGR